MKSLAPLHLADLRRSGLQDETIAACCFQAVPPHDNKLAGVNSAYAIPYWQLDGTRNCFERWRLFPPITGKGGHTQKYWQPPGSDVQLYLPPLFSWQTVAVNPKCPLLVTEGEKKAIAGCQRGLFCLGVGGVWNWRQRLDTGERLVIPTLDLFVWPGREVLLVPDSDCWRPEKAQALSGFYALGQELSSRGASVSFLKLPEQSGVKVGLDDWVVHVGAEWEHLWLHLERLALDDVRLKACAAWWQQWREREATAESFRHPQAEDLELTRAGSRYLIRFPVHRLQFCLARLTNARGGVSAEVSVKIGNAELLGPTDLGLKSDTGRDKLARTLKGLATVASLPWKRLLERACQAVLSDHRTGAPMTPLVPSEHVQVPYLMSTTC